ncbi:hypothetical protein ACH492_03195 [Streptomyces sp. NPDC019443]|uniref:hypothetical protein n=1 Tax=Streptomyces sp. NPDC019443 TaxID=3365061 RepID=UPI003793DFA3
MVKDLVGQAVVQCRGLDPATLDVETAAFIEGAHLLWLLDPEQVDLVAVHRSYFEGLAARLRP